ncbi:MAG: 23S rRNA (cytosine(1962)-C(5))-methyltransferase RlmI [Lentisphaerae bacterium]|nr:23S rRNA (cytosine(1962)-C(5))-methyltransferase RlmI [Lentisphaerota bacterium]
MSKVILKPGREKSLLKRHPWIYSGAIGRVEGAPVNGSTVEVCASSGEFLAWGALSQESQLALRIWSFERNAVIDRDFFAEKLRQSMVLRQQLNIPQRASAWRLCASEADGLPGITIDVYNDYAVVQLTSAGAEVHRSELVQALLELHPWRGIYERSDVPVRKYEKLPERTGVLHGEMPPPRLEVHEDTRKFYVDIINGHKSGFYCDQRESRSMVQRFSANRNVLNLFSYTGGFGVAAALGNARNVINVDSSAPALEMAAANFELNKIASERYENITADCFSFLRKCRGEKRKFDLIVLDPPKLVDSMRNMNKGCRAYKDAMLQSFHLLPPGGLLFTFSCSGLVTRELFAKIAADAACDATCDARIVAELGQGADHPVSTAFPEARYLKGLMIMRCN